MIVEPLILLSLPYWRRNNDRYCSSIFSTFKTRLQILDKVKKEYNNLINLDLSSKSLFKTVFRDLKYLRSNVQQFGYSKRQFTRDKDINKIKVIKPNNNDILNTTTPEDAKVSRMIIASVFQNYIGKPNDRTQYKQNIARFSAFNSLNMLNTNTKTHTVEVRLKHGSDDPQETKEFIDLLTDLFIKGILLKNDNSFITLNSDEIDTIIQLNQIINL